MEKDPKRSVMARNIERFAFEAEPGDCYVRENPERLSFACPGCGQWGGISVGNPKPPVSPSWLIVAGELRKPETLVLHPSINCVGCCGWHGFLGGQDGKSPGLFKSQ